MGRGGVWGQEGGRSRGSCEPAPERRGPSGWRSSAGECPHPSVSAEAPRQPRGTRLSGRWPRCAPGQDFLLPGHVHAPPSPLQPPRAEGRSENPPPPTSAPGFSFKFETHLSSFIIIWQVSFKKKIHLMKYFCLNTSTLDLQKCAHLEYI